jgi:N-methylhydantoinase A/oxoprolinase/acetone carboxylase beta subunit
MSDFEFASFHAATEDARALLARLYREIGVSAVAAALNLDHEREAAHVTQRYAPDAIQITLSETRAA